MRRRSSRGNREISPLARTARRLWSAPGRRGAVAGDARRREVRPHHSSGEAAEQSRATGGGGGGAKGGDRGERGPAKHAPATDPGRRVPGAGPRATSRKAQEEGEVHRAPAPHQPRGPRGGVLRAQAQGGTGGGWGDVAGVRGRSRAQARGTARRNPPRCIWTPD